MQGGVGPDGGSAGALPSPAVVRLQVEDVAGGHGGGGIVPDVEYFRQALAVGLDVEDLPVIEVDFEVAISVGTALRRARKTGNGWDELSFLRINTNSASLLGHRLWHWAISGALFQNKQPKYQSHGLRWVSCRPCRATSSLRLDQAPLLHLHSMTLGKLRQTLLGAGLDLFPLACARLVTIRSPAPSSCHHLTTHLTGSAFQRGPSAAPPPRLGGRTQLTRSRRRTGP